MGRTERKNQIMEELKKGLSNKEISEKLNIHYATVCTYVREIREEDPNQPKTDNTDRHLCKTCCFRGNLNSSCRNRCDFIVIVGHSRGCPASKCTVYKRGPRATYKGKAGSDDCEL